MGFVPDSTGKPVYNDDASTQDDLQAAADFALSRSILTGSPIFATKAALDASPGTVIGQHASVNADTTAVNNGDYVWSGSAWIVSRIASLADTGWQNLTVPSGYTSSSAKARVLNGVLHVDAGAAKTVGGGWSIGNTPLTFPTAIATLITRTVKLTAIDSANAPLLMNATASGITVAAASASGVATIWGGGPVN